MLETASRPVCSLHQPELTKLLNRLHWNAGRDKVRFLFRILPERIISRLTGRKLAGRRKYELMKDMYLAITREQGELLYVTARAIRARRVIEFGTSHGISTIYLAAAVRDNGGGLVTGTEHDMYKWERALSNLEQAGLAPFAEVRPGDGRKTLTDIKEAVDMVFLDGWKDLYLPVLEMLMPMLRRGAVVIADNVSSHHQALRPYVAFMQAEDSGFASVTLPFAHGFEYSVYLG